MEHDHGSRRRAHQLRHCALAIALGTLGVVACSGADEDRSGPGGGNADAAGDAHTDATSDSYVPQPEGSADAPEGDVAVTPDTGMPDAGAETSIPDATAEAQPSCPPPSTPAGADVVLEPPFDTSYAAYDLGPVPGAPAGARLGGCVIKYDDNDTLLIAVESEAATGTIYAVPVVRNACGHIVAFEGTATLYASTPYVDANLVYGPNDLMFYTEWPVNRISQLLPGEAAPARTTELAPLGVAGGGPGGLGFVPPGLAAAGEMRILTWSAGYWYHLTYAPDGALFTLSSPVQATTLPNGPGGFAYVPQGSPGFPAQSVIVAEWSMDTVAVYEVDAQGDPNVSTRRPFFSSFPKPWGAYFEPVTGDYLFLTWGAAGGEDRVYITQGFPKPPGLF